MNATELWQLSPEQFNEWRRENDYPLIWDLLVASLPYFGDWMTEQKIEKSVIFQIGIARFISSRSVLSLCVYMSDDKTRLYETASSALESLRKSGLIRSETRFEPYAMWLAGKHGKDEVKRVQSLLSVSENNKGEAQVLGKHRLLNIGGLCACVPVWRYTSFICC
nr:hypothetical protein [Aeromonas bestiarum]